MKMKIEWTKLLNKIEQITQRYKKTRKDNDDDDDMPEPW